MHGQHSNHFLQLFIEGFGGLSNCDDIITELVERRHLAAAQFVPMLLVNAEQFHEEIYRVVVPDFIFRTPLV